MRIAYWSTACLEPRLEAVSKEVLGLARGFPGSWVFSVSKHFLARFSPLDACAGVNARMAGLLRLVAPVLERAFDISHVYGDMTPWVYHKSLRHRPLIHTVTQDSGQPVVEFLARCSAVVAQTDATLDRLLSCGVPKHRAYLKYPGVDLKRFVPARSRVPDSRSPRVLFSTSPRTAEELEPRGVFVLLDAAMQARRASFRLLYRRWNGAYTSLEPTRQAVLARGISNVEVVDAVVDDISAEYQRSDFTVIPFTQRTGGKECPNSAIESLACGVPVLISRECPFARFVEEHSCGVAFDPSPEGLVAAVEEGLSRWSDLSIAARRVAEEHFDAARLLAFYRSLYEREAMRRHAHAGPHVVPSRE